MRDTFGDRFRKYESRTKDRLSNRFRAAAVVLCQRYSVDVGRADDLVQEAFAKILPTEYDLDPEHDFDEDPDQGKITVIWTILERQLISDLRTQRRTTSLSDIRDRYPEKDDDSIFDTLAEDAAEVLRSPHSEASIIAYEEYCQFINETEDFIANLESVLGTRRRNFRVKARRLFDTFCSDPEKYVQTPGPPMRLHAKQLAADLDMDENAFQQFKSRVDAVLSGSGLSLDRILLGVLVHKEARELGVVPNTLRIQF